MSKVRMTLEEHQKMGKKLKEIRKTLFEIKDICNRAYNKTDDVNNHMRKLIDRLDLVRSGLENRLNADFPDKSDHEITHVYYSE